MIYCEPTTTLVRVEFNMLLNSNNLSGDYFRNDQTFFFSFAQ